jgi:hypothetical protein
MQASCITQIAKEARRSAASVMRTPEILPTSAGGNGGAGV